MSVWAALVLGLINLIFGFAFGCVFQQYRIREMLKKACDQAEQDKRFIKLFLNIKKFFRI